MAIIFTQEDLEYTIPNSQAVKKWIKSIVESEKKKIGDIAVVWCSDAFILEVNNKYLKHDYLTDIITFDYCENNTIAGDLIISLDTVRANAKDFGVEFHVEQLRVLAHGILHLCGYGDASDEEIVVMRSKEDFYIEKYAI